MFCLVISIVQRKGETPKFIKTIYVFPYISFNNFIILMSFIPLFSRITQDRNLYPIPPAKGIANFPGTISWIGHLSLLWLELNSLFQHWEWFMVAQDTVCYFPFLCLSHYMTLPSLMPAPSRWNSRINQPSTLRKTFFILLVTSLLKTHQSLSFRINPNSLPWSAGHMRVTYS